MVRLSVCIATRNRGEFLVETLKCLLNQIIDGVEIVIVDGASTDNSRVLVSELNAPSDKLRYFYEDENSGVDRDFDKSVEYALGKYCWLFSDDDLLVPGAISTVIKALQTEPEILVVNASLHTKTFKNLLSERVLNHFTDKTYDFNGEHAFLELGSYLSFIGAIVVSRDFWISRERSGYHGSAFAHLAVIFQAPLASRIKLLASPLIKIRYGNSEWAPRGFEIWSQQWPSLVKRLTNLPVDSVNAVADAGILGIVKICLLYRGMGLYNSIKYNTSVKGRYSMPLTLMLKLIAALPVKFTNTVLTVLSLSNSNSAINVYRLSNSPAASKITNWISIKCGVKE